VSIGEQVSAISNRRAGVTTMKGIFLALIMIIGAMPLETV
jgi:hypothetical protein